MNKNNELVIYLESITFSYRNPTFSTSPHSFEVPPPTTFFGLFASILGRGENNVKANRKIIKEEIQDKIEKLEIYIEDESLKNVKETAILRFNADETKQKIKWSTVFTTTIFINLKVWVKITFRDKQLKEMIEKNIKENVFLYTPYLGSSTDLIKKIEVKELNELEKLKGKLWKLVEKKNTYVEKGSDIICIGRIPWKYDENGEWVWEEVILKKY